MKNLCAVIVLAVSTAQADTIFVDDDNCPGPGDGSELDPYCSIQTAIDNAVDTDEIVVAPGTYFETINFLGKAITLRSCDGRDVTTIDAQQTGTVVTCNTGEGPDTVLEGFAITGGSASGMRNDNSNPTVIHCTFIGNSAVTGGGMFNTQSSNPTVSNCLFSENSATTAGGMGNFLSSPSVTACTFSGNSALAGGGMGNLQNSSPTVTACVFSGNSVDGGGGGMINFSNSPTVVNCRFSGNLAGVGGGMSNSSASPMVIGCTFSGNTAADFSGGMENNLSSPTVTNCILWSNSPDEINGSGIVTFSDIRGGWPGAGNIDTAPLFADAAGGDLRLLPGSPCIDAGNNAAVPKGTTTDLDGNPRFIDDPDTPDCPQAPGQCGDPPVVDMGAYEFQLCPWDCGGDNDGTVGLVDFQALLAQWGGPGSCDFDGGGVGINDFLALLANWGPCP